MEQQDQLFRIGISGSYGGMNLGDEAILDGILSQLRSSLSAEITVFSQKPKDTLSRHKVERAVPCRDMTRKEVAREIERLDLFVLGGGGILYDRDVHRYLREVNIAHELKVPVFIYAVSAGPLTLTATRNAVRDALNLAAVITVRDRQGYRLLEDVGVDREIHLTADPALLIDPEEIPRTLLRAEGVEFERPLVGFSVREPGPAAPDIDPQHYYALLANTADFIVDRLDADVVFVPMERTDVQHSHGVVAQMHRSERAEVLRRKYTAHQTLGLMDTFEFAVGMRLHFLIFAALRGTPFVALPYASKVMGLVEDLEMDIPPLGDIGTGQLIAMIDRSWDTRDEIRHKIKCCLPPLQVRARKTNQLLVDLLRKQSGSAGLKSATA